MNYGNKCNPNLKITRGSTTSLSFVFDRDVESIDVMHLTIVQDQKEVVELTKDDALLDGKQATFMLSQSDTLSFVAGRPVFIQIRYRVGDYVPPTPIFEASVYDVLKGVEI